MSTSSADVVETDVIINGQQAISSLQLIGESALSTDEKIKTLLQEIVNFSETSGASLASVAAQFQALDAQMKTNVFGNFSPASWDTVNNSIAAQSAIINQNNADLADHNSLLLTTNEEYGGLGSSVNDFNTAEGALNATYVEAGQNINGVITNSETMNQTLEETAPAATAAAGGINLVNTALRVMTAMLVFEVINAIVQTFTQAAQKANDYYNSLLQINILQDNMARGGVIATQQQLLGVAQELEATWKNISDVDMVNAVSQAGLLTTQYQLSVDQVKQIVNDAAALVIQGKVKDLQTGIDDIIATFKGDTASSKWASLVGLNFNKAQFDAEAAKLGIEEVGGAFTPAQTATIILAMDNDKLYMSQDQVNKAMATAPGIAGQMQSAWSNALEAMGKFLTPLLQGLELVATSILQHIIPAIQGWESYFIGLVAAIAAGATIIDTALIDHANITDALKNHWADANKQIADYLINLTALGNVGTTTNTPVVPGAPGDEPPVTLEKSTIDQALKDYEDYLNQLAADNARFAMQQEQAQASYNNSVLQEIENYDNSVAQEKMNFQLQMQELDQEYTFNLQSALEDRNARQVLTDQAKYQMDKERLQAEEKLRLAELKMNEQLRLEELAQNYALEQEKAKEDHQLQLEELQQAEKDKLMALAESLDAQYKLQGLGVKDIYDLLTSYYGPGGYFDQLQDKSLQSMITKDEAYLAELTNLINQILAQNARLPWGGGTAPPPGPSQGGRAKGGIDFADTATNLTFGEAGPEMAITIPMSQSSPLPNMSFGGSRGGGGNMALHIALSEGLEASIIENTLTEVAVSLEKVRRSR